MRALRRLAWLIFIAPLAALFSLSGAVGKDIAIHSLSEFIARRFNIQVPEVETVIEKIWFVVPIVAAIATLYLYHIAQSLLTPAPQPVRIQENRSKIRTTIDLISGIAAFIIVGGFIISVIYFGWHSEYVSALPYKELRYLSDDDLRHRAFSVSEKLRALSSQYAERQSEINAQYEKDLVPYKKEKAQYDQDKAEYDKARTSCPSGYTYDAPHYSSTLLGTQSSTPSLAFPSILGKPCKIPNPPGNEPRPPSRPVFKVDQQWVSQATTAQEESAAVWEELHHRLGRYVEFFEVPRNYNSNSSHPQESAKQLEDLANKLH
jgi:hypothetical protein